ncbi:hypothetical protein QWJ34_22590 [Saccharibacillus sp. CPCC 101409]|uniref:hypothetical protein n=1 Tax=Saccharibacillus sp. CPCC 101409 TaxID=3058041 RepID=UPI0026735B0B|nr:hypothetical protein [Saccharibacillus sp. CPCC 101409]MDO3412571.1 hypothetical protein [Saccharibacillus sp. CPCC 101409]
MAIPERAGYNKMQAGHACPKQASPREVPIGARPVLCRFSPYASLYSAFARAAAAEFRPLESNDVFAQHYPLYRLFSGENDAYPQHSSIFFSTFRIRFGFMSTEG